MAQKKTIQTVINRYHLTPDQIIQENGLTIIKKTGIIKIQKSENIKVNITKMEVAELSTAVGKEDAVYLVGEGTKQGKDGSTKTIQGSGSATPFNCSFNYKLEVAHARLRSRLVLELCELEWIMGEDELNLMIQGNGHPAQTSDDDKLIQEALSKIPKK